MPFAAEMDGLDYGILLGRDMRDHMQPRSERIVERVLAIPPGFVRTYGDIDPRAPRLVGLVLSRTDGLPWHRVVRADGTLPMGAKQRRLLRAEGVRMRGD